MNNRWFYTSIAFVVLLLNVYPFYQLVSTNGYLFYLNACDEESYLQYDFSVACQSYTRLAQYVVTLSHEMGFSGGWTNLIFDMVSLPVFMFFASRCFFLLEYDRKTSNCYSFLLTILPLAFNRFNPLIDDFFMWSFTSKNIYWITTPAATFLPFVRTPEPQLSFVILSIMVYWSLKKKSFWYLYPVLPLLYPFVGIPIAFLVVGLHLKELFPEATRRMFSAPIMSYCLLGTMSWFYATFIISPSTKEFLTATHLPIVSFTGVCCLLIALWGYRRCDPRFRVLLTTVAVAPFAVTNLQVVSGWFGSPHSYEQYVGNVCVCFVLLLSIGVSKQGNRSESTSDFNKTLKGNLQYLAKLPGFLLRPQQLQWGLFVICWGLAMCSGIGTFRENYFANAKLPLTNDVLVALRTKSERVVIDDQRLAALTSMIYPKQASTLLGFERSFSPVCTEEGVRDYLLAKKTILHNEAMAERFQKILLYLDHAYQFESEDVYLLHNYRKTSFRLRHDTSLVPEENDSSELYYVLIDNENLPPRLRDLIFNLVKSPLSQIDLPTIR